MFYKNGCYREKAIDVINKTLFIEPYDPEKKYYDIYGFDSYGFDEEGYNREGYDREGFNRHGFNREGFDKEGFDRSGYDKDGFDREGFDYQGKDRDGRLWVEYAKLLNPGEEKTIQGMKCTHDGIRFKCCDCVENFIFSYSDVKRNLEKDWEWPRRCKSCREKKKIEDFKYEGLREAMKNENAIVYTGREQAFRFRGPYEEL